MQARAGSIGAALALVPREGGGTVVRLRWPD
jgi:nitrate/nitrite-specific signal transduction histidine kinase